MVKLNCKIESHFIIGILSWRDNINSYGGICLNGKTKFDAECISGER